MTQPTPMDKKDTKEQDELSQVSKLRELLFGQQFQDYEKRSVRLEEKIKREFEDLRSEINLRLNTLEVVEKNSIKDFEEFKKNTSKVENEIRQIILGNVKDLTTEINRVQKSLIAELSAEVKVLDDEKLNKTALASMLGELIMQLNAWPKVVEKSH